MNGFKEQFSKLVSLEYFNPDAFVEDAVAPRELCGFVLSLALIYNDIKNTSMLNFALSDAEPKDADEISKERGEYSGLHDFIDRISFGILHELFNLIKDNKKVLEHKLFKETIKSLNKDVKKLWKALVNVSLDQDSENRFAKDLMKIRHKVIYHYDPKAISNGYKFFFVKTKEMDRAYISRGRNMPESRFYFVDAAAQGCIKNLYGSEDMGQFFSSVNDNLQKLNHSLWYVIINFIAKRGYAFRKPTT